MEERNPPARRVLTHWHMIFGTFLHLRMEPAKIEVQMEVQAAKAMPKLDILLLRPLGQETWNEEQRALLPDGLRESQAGRIMLEFKYTESFGSDAVRQTLVYDWLYRNSEQLTEQQLSTFLVTSKSPSPKQLAELGYQPSDRPGVFRSSHEVCRNVDVISLNDLSDEPHNLAFKLFASKQEVRTQTYHTLITKRDVSQEVIYFMDQLNLTWLAKGGGPLITDMTAEEIIEAGRQITLMSMPHLPYEDRLRGIPTSELLKVIPASERLKGIPARELLEVIPASELLDDMADEELLKLLLSKKHLQELFKANLNQAG